MLRCAGAREQEAMWGAVDIIVAGIYIYMYMWRGVRPTCVWRCDLGASRSAAWLRSDTLSVRVKMLSRSADTSSASVRSICR